MNFEFFEALSPNEASKFLQNFLEVESRMAIEFVESQWDQNVGAPYSIESVGGVLWSLVDQVRMIEAKPHEELPSWIQGCSSYARGLVEFDSPSKIFVLRGAHYIGETFVRSYSALSWAVGNIETAEQNMPVVTGFSSGLEMAPILIIENLFMRVVVDDAGPEVINAAVSFWCSKVPD